MRVSIRAPRPEDAPLHRAAVLRSVERPDECVRANVELTAELLELARQRGHHREGVAH